MARAPGCVAPGAETSARSPEPILESPAPFSLRHHGPTGRGTMRKAWWKQLYVQVLIAIAIGIALGHFAPDLGAKMQPLGEAFIKLVKMVIAPVIFVTVVAGIGKMGDLRHVGRIG